MLLRPAGGAYGPDTHTRYQGPRRRRTLHRHKRFLRVRIGLRVGGVRSKLRNGSKSKSLASNATSGARRMRARPLPIAPHVISQCRGKRRIDVIKWRVAVLQSYVGNLEPQLSQYSPSAAGPARGVSAMVARRTCHVFPVTRTFCRIRTPHRGVGSPLTLRHRCAVAVRHRSPLLGAVFARFAQIPPRS